MNVMHAPQYIKTDSCPQTGAIRTSVYHSVILHKHETITEIKPNAEHCITVACEL